MKIDLNAIQSIRVKCSHMVMLYCTVDLEIELETTMEKLFLTWRWLYRRRPPCKWSRVQPAWLQVGLQNWTSNTHKIYVPCCDRPFVLLSFFLPRLMLPCSALSLPHDESIYKLQNQLQACLFTVAWSNGCTRWFLNAAIPISHAIIVWRFPHRHVQCSAKSYLLKFYWVSLIACVTGDCYSIHYNFRALRSRCSIFNMRSTIFNHVLFALLCPQGTWRVLAHVRCPLFYCSGKHTVRIR